MVVSDMTETQIRKCHERLERFLIDLLEPVGRSERRQLGRRLCARVVAGWRAQVSRTDGIAFAGWKRAGHAAVRRTEPLGLASHLGTPGPSHDGGVGAGISLGH